MAYGWEGELVRLVPLDEEKHLANAQLWINESEVTQWLLAGDLPMSKLAEREWFEKVAKDTQNQIVFAIETLEGLHIGFSGIERIDLRNGTAITGAMIGNVPEQNKGYGSDAAKVRTRYAFDVLGLRMLYSSVLESNGRSRRVLEKAGYRQCGVYPKKYWKRGRFVDEILFSLSREDWLAGQ